MTVFVSVMVQALPFLILGTVLSGAITAFVPARFFERALPGKPIAAVPVAGMAGVVLPACEYGSVPVARALIRRGVAPAAAFAFLLASPAINPVVLVSTAVAFPGQPVMVAGPARGQPAHRDRDGLVVAAPGPAGVADADEAGRLAHRTRLGRLLGLVPPRPGSGRRLPRHRRVRRRGAQRDRAAPAGSRPSPTVASSRSSRWPCWPSCCRSAPRQTRSLPPR